MTTSPALDPGSATAKVALDDATREPIPSPAVDGDWRARVSGALAAASVALPVDSICLVVPEAWLDGSVDGTIAQESLRHACEDELGIARITWTSQLAAVAAWAAREHGPGHYLVCDIGADGVRTAVLEVTGPVITILAAHSSAGGGWREFDTAVRSVLAGGDDPLPADWYRAARKQNRRARTVLDRAAVAPDWLESWVYEFTGPGGTRKLLAGQMIDCFAPTQQRIRDGAADVLNGRPVDIAILTGGLGWFPLALAALAEAAGVNPKIEEPGAAARGGLLFARDTVRLAPPPALAQVTLPMHRIENGQLEEVSLALPWTEPFASLADELVLDDPMLTVDIGGQPATVQLPELISGPCRIGVRRGWTGSSALVLRPASGAGAPVVVGIDARAASDR